MLHLAIILGTLDVQVEPRGTSEERPEPETVLHPILQAQKGGKMKRKKRQRQRERERD